MNYTAITIIYNPNSTGSSEALARSFKGKLRKQVPAVKVYLRATQYAGHAEELAYSLAKKSEHALIISSSGDGGYHEVVNGVMKARREGFDVTAGLLPAGNANDHYHNLHNDDLVELIKNGKRTYIDALKLSGLSEGNTIERYGHSYIGFGLTPFVGKELNKTKLNIFNQVWIVAKALFDLQPVRLVIGRKARYYDSVIFSNVDKMSKYLKISQPSRVTDGKFEVTIFRRRNKLKLIILLFKASIVGVKENLQVQKFTLKTVHKTLVQIDGEIVTLDPKTKVTITADKRTLPCVV